MDGLNVTGIVNEKTSSSGRTVFIHPINTFGENLYFFFRRRIKSSAHVGPIAVYT